MHIIDTHSHLWLRQDTQWNGLPIRTIHDGRSIFLGEEVQMLPPFMIDGVNSAEVFLSNMNYAQVSAAVVVQELIDGCQNDYLLEVSRRYPDRFLVTGMVDCFGDHPAEEASRLIEQGFKGISIPGHRLIVDNQRVYLDSPMIAMFKLMETCRWQSLRMSLLPVLVCALPLVTLECLSARGGRNR